MIGVTSQISTGTTGSQGNVGIGFAIPINTVRNVAAQIITIGKAEHAFLGVSALPVDAAAREAVQACPPTSGLLVQDVDEGQRRRQGRSQGRQDG